MTWDYRIIKRKTAWGPTFSIHEVFYDDAGRVIGWTEKPIDVCGESLFDAFTDYKNMAEAFEKPVLIESKLRPK